MQRSVRNREWGHSSTLMGYFSAEECPKISMGTLIVHRVMLLCRGVPENNMGTLIVHRVMLLCRGVSP